MKIICSKNFTAERAWGALDIANLNGTTVRLHWTDQPYKWHVNDGEEVFAVLDGIVEMHYRERSDEGGEAGVSEHIAVLEAGDVFYAQVGCEHVAHPRGEARILVIEKEGSV
ncbi:cupin [Paraburkholderia sp. J94]|uniref:cupin n=1 Tax=Paraburkholderia sp. J94 TaxID=2805441 RepID=UPI002AB20D7D|nr:cupin [Paraburkholderia sp. J94]